MKAITFVELPDIELVRLEVDGFETIYFTVHSFYGTIFTSPDGLAWTMRVLSGAFFTSVTFGQNAWLAFDNGGTFATSTNALDWSLVQNSGIVGVDGVAYGTG